MKTMDPLLKIKAHNKNQSPLNLGQSFVHLSSHGYIVQNRDLRSNTVNGVGLFQTKIFQWVL